MFLIESIFPNTIGFSPKQSLASSSSCGKDMVVTVLATLLLHLLNCLNFKRGEAGLGIRPLSKSCMFEFSFNLIQFGIQAPPR